jgi:hypothetical protein
MRSTNAPCWPRSTSDPPVPDGVASLRATTAEERTATADAMAWLHELPVKGKWPARSVQRAAQAAEISVKVLRRAREKLAVVATRDGFGSGSRFIWSLRVDALSFHRCPSCTGGDNRGFHVPEGIYGDENENDEGENENDEATE